MKIYVFFIVVFLCCSQAFAQDRNTKKSIPIPAIPQKEKEPEVKPIPAEPEAKVKVEATDEKGNPENEIPEQEFSMFDNSTLINPGKIYEERWNKKAVEQGLKIEAMADQFLGDIRSNGAFVNIVCRDHEYPDGDLVRVFVNDDVFVPSLLLTSGYKGFKVPLNPGINKIVFLALNQGDSGPNTAQFLVYNDKQELVSSKKWNLLTGVKATVLVIKDEEPTKEEE